MTAPVRIPPVPASTCTIEPWPTTTTASITIGNGNHIIKSNLIANTVYTTAWAPITPPEPKLDAIKCPSCGQGNVKKTEIDGIVECAYCGRQFTLRY